MSDYKRIQYNGKTVQFEIELRQPKCPQFKRALRRDKYEFHTMKRAVISAA